MVFYCITNALCVNCIVLTGSLGTSRLIEALALGDNKVTVKLWTERVTNYHQEGLTSGVSAPPTMVRPRAGCRRGISMCEISPSRMGSRVMPVGKGGVTESIMRYKREGNDLTGQGMMELFHTLIKQ